MTTPPLTTAQQVCHAQVIDFLAQIHHAHIDHQGSEILKTKQPHQINLTDTAGAIINLEISSAAEVETSPLAKWQLHIEIGIWLEHKAIIHLWSWLTDTEVREEQVLLYLLRKNEKFQFGGFSMDDNGCIRFQASLLGETCQINEFALALGEVINAVDLYLLEIHRQLQHIPAI
ncbi:MAG: hypothetical protein WCO45_16615 [Pseudanabaena sp. ELA607]|jgi:hypothetical protein